MVPQIALSDWKGKLPWQLASFTLAQPDPSETAYMLDLDAKYQNEPIRLDGKAGLTPAAMPEWAVLRARALKSDVTVNAALKNGLVDLKNI